MLTKSWRRSRSPLALAFVLVLAAPALVQAQHTGLFPLAPIRRERVPCPNEDPVYRLYRQEFFGYHPTCWRRFPPNWGCPSPEAPNQAESFTKYPRQRPAAVPSIDEESAPPEMGPEALPGTPSRPNPTELPNVPRRPGSLFNLDEKPGAAPREESPAPERPAPRLPNPNPNANPGPGASRSLQPLADPAAPVASPGLSGDSTSANELPGNVGGVDPVLALPDPATPTGATSPTPGATDALGAVPDSGAGSPPLSARAPQRRGLLGSLFGGLGLRRRQ